MTLLWAGSHDLPQYSSKLPGAGFTLQEAAALGQYKSMRKRRLSWRDLDS